MNGGRLAAAALVVVLGITGCSSKKDTDAGGASGSRPEATAPDGDGHEGEGDDHGHTEPTLVDPATGKQGKIRSTDKYSAATPPPPDFRPADVVGASGAIPLEASTSPPCVEHGKKLTTVFRSEPGVSIAAQIKWPNDEFTNLDNIRGTIGADGTYTWSVEVKPTAFYGIADIQAAVIDERPSGRGRNGTQGNWQVVVAPPGRC